MRVAMLGIENDKIKIGALEEVETLKKAREYIQNELNNIPSLKDCKVVVFEVEDDFDMSTLMFDDGDE
jgi:hypothetical protein